MKKLDSGIKELLNFPNITVEYDKNDNRSYLPLSELYALGDQRLYNVYLTEKGYMRMMEEADKIEGSGIIYDSLAIRGQMINVANYKSMEANDISRIFASSVIPLYSAMYSNMWKEFTYVQVEYIPYDDWNKVGSIYADLNLKLTKIKRKNTTYLVPMTSLEASQLDSEEQTRYPSIIKEYPTVFRLSSHHSTLYKFYQIIGLLPFIVAKSIANDPHDYSEELINLASSQSFSNVDQFKTLLTIFPERIRLVRE